MPKIGFKRALAWNSQPQEAARYADIGLSAIPLPGLIAGQSTHGLSTVKVGTVTRSATNGGLASGHVAGASMLRALIPGSALGTTGGASLLCVFRTTSTSTDIRIGSLGSDNGSVGNTIFSIGAMGGASSGLRVTIGGSSQNFALEYSGAVVNDGAVHAASITASIFSGTTFATGGVHLDGRTLRAASSLGGVLGVSSTYNWIVACGFRRGGTDNAGPACDVLLCVPFFGELADAEARELTANPWQLFEPRRIFVPVSVGGGSDVTVNLSGISASFAQTSPVISSIVALSGEIATASAGIVLPAFSFALSGQAAAAAAGGLSPSFSRGLSGQSATFAAGSVVPSVAIAAIGLQATFAAGILTASSSGGDTATLAGEAVSFAQTAPSISVSVALTGITATMAAGLLTAASGTATITVKAGSWLRYKKLS